jgi:hypothetical protein
MNVPEGTPSTLPHERPEGTPSTQPAGRGGVGNGLQRGAYIVEPRLYGFTGAPTRLEVPPPSSAPGLGSPRPHLRRDWAHPARICAGTALTPPTSAPGLGSPRPHLRRDCAAVVATLVLVSETGTARWATAKSGGRICSFRPTWRPRRLASSSGARNARAQTRTCARPRTHARTRTPTRTPAPAYKHVRARTHARTRTRTRMRARILAFPRLCATGMPPEARGNFHPPTPKQSTLRVPLLLADPARACLLASLCGSRGRSDPALEAFLRTPSGCVLSAENPKCDSDGEEVRRRANSGQCRLKPRGESG